MKVYIPFSVVTIMFVILISAVGFTNMDRNSGTTSTTKPSGSPTFTMTGGEGSCICVTMFICV